MLLIGEDPKKYIEDYSKQFVDNFVSLLKTTHGEKKVQLNQLYQQVIQDKTVSAGPCTRSVRNIMLIANVKSTFT